MKKVLASLITLVLVLSSLSAGAYDVTMYAPDGRVATVDSSQVQAWKDVGWYDYKPTVTMYTLDGRTASVPSWDVEAWKNVGWYTTEPISIYSLDGRKLVIAREQFDAYAKVGWYSEPVAKLYSIDGRAIIVTLKEVSLYRKVGWYPLHSIFFESNLKKLKKQFPLKFEQHYAGEPESGDLPRDIYRGSPAIHADFWSNKCVWVGFYLKDVFPYLQLYADSNGMITVDAINAAFSDSGIYGANFRDLEYNSFGSYEQFCELIYYDEAPGWYFGDYDCTQIGIECSYYGKIDFNTALCSLNTLV